MKSIGGLPILDCNADGKDVGGNTERCNEKPSAEDEIVTKNNEVC